MQGALLGGPVGLLPPAALHGFGPAGGLVSAMDAQAALAGLFAQHGPQAPPQYQLAQLLAYGAGQPLWAPPGLGQQGGGGGAPARPEAQRAPAAAADERVAKTTNYAARHQAAEKRRRNRINDRLAALREVVPVASVNTADFLGELLSYVTQLQSLAGVQPKQPLPASAAPVTTSVAPAVLAAAPPSGHAEGEEDEDGGGSDGVASDEARSDGVTRPARKRRRSPSSA